MEPGYKQLALSFDEPVEEVRYDVLLEPEPLRKEVDFANVQRVFEESKAFQFSAPNKIKQPRDVAYIFKQLETAAVENAFAVLVKDGKPTVIHLGMGKMDATFAPIDSVVVADKKINADKIYFVHNHPSGNVKASPQDVQLLQVWRNFFGDKMQPGIIINTRSGLYGEFDANQYRSSSHELVAGEEQQYPVKLYSFSKLVFEKEYRETDKVQSSHDVARFVSSQRLGKRPKLSYLVMSSGCDILANIHTQRSGIKGKDIKELSQQITRDVVTFGGKHVISYGSAKIGKGIIEQLSSDLRQKEIRLLDHIQLLPDVDVKNALGLGTGAYHYMSASDEGWINPLREPGLSYGNEQVRGNEVEDAGLSEEERNIVEKAKADGTYLKAPNGQPTKLSPKQWAQVRTKAFKDWFGDWEKATRIEKLRDSRPIVATGKEYQGKYDLDNKSAASYVLNSLRDEYPNNDTGKKIKISRRGAEKVTSHDIDNEIHLKSIALIPKMIRDAIFIAEAKNEKNKNGYDSYRYYVVGLKIDQQDYTAKLVIGVKGHEAYYDHALTEIEKTSLIDNIGPVKTGLDGNEAVLSMVKDKRLLSNVQADASKIVDKNGEPLVVYHGTAAKFNTFQSEKGLYWFAKNSEYSESMAEERGGARVVDVYLNMKNPYFAALKPGQFTNPTFEKPIIKEARDGKYDGVILRADTDNELLSDTFYVAFSPAQIKSATNNVGTFDVENADIRYREAEDGITAFAKKYGLDVGEVQKYANCMLRENLQGANWAFIEMKRKIRIDNSDKSLGEFAKIFTPIKAELYENFGNIDVLREKQVQAAMEQRNVMEAARKRAAEASEAERKRLEEFELMSDGQLDSAYFRAIEANDEARMRDLVNEAARRNGYVSLDEHRMEHTAPSYDEAGIDKSLVDVANNRDQIRESLNEQFRMNRTESRDESASAIQNALDAIDRGENPTVTIYRAVPKSLKEGRVRNGDWVTLSESYAKGHGRHVLGISDYRVMKEVVPAENLYWDGNDINEWGYDDRSDYRYKNTKHNRKLNDLITRDDAGNIIPLSQRFNSRKQDIRFRFIGEKGAANLDKAEETTTRLDNFAVAREMEEAGKDAKTVKIATGWERGADGKWRYEEADFEIDVNGLARKNSLWDRLPWGAEYNGLISKLLDYDINLNQAESARFDELSERARNLQEVYEATDERYLDDYVKDRKLFDAYPELKRVRVEMYNEPKSNMEVTQYRGATWYVGQNLIRVNEWVLSQDDFRSVLTHEVQHAIQNIEGFAKGGNSNTYKEHLESLKEKHDAWSMLAEFDRKHEELGQEVPPIDVYNAVRDEYLSLGFKFGDDGFSSREAFDKGFNLWVRGYDKEGYEEAYNEYQSLTDRFGLGLGNDRYRQLAGEVEARNVQVRLNMPMEERRASLASETEDVAREKQIFLNETREAAASMSSRKASIHSQIKDMGDKLHTPIRIVKAEDVRHNNPDMEKRMREAKGWFNTKSGEVVVIMENHTSMEDVTKTVLHEVIAHKGLRGIMSEKTFQTMCESVFRSMPAALGQSYLRQYGTPAIAGEEYMAHVAENGASASMMSSITSAIKVALNSIGIQVNYTNKEIQALLKRSQRHLEKNPEQRQRVASPAAKKRTVVKPRKRGRGI